MLITDIIFSYLFIVSGLIVLLLQVISLPFYYVKRFRNAQQNFVAKTTYLHWMWVPVIGQWWGNIDVTLCLSKRDAELLGKESAILVMNHRCQLDWIVVFLIGSAYNVMQNIKSVIKSAISYVPVAGWSLLMNEHIFVHRNKKKDEAVIKRKAENYSEFGYNYWLLLYCEGTRFTTKKHKLCQDYAIKNGLEPLKYHLMPRSKGFHLVGNGLRTSVSAVYDVTACFGGKVEPTLKEFMAGHPVRADVRIRRIAMSEIPRDEQEVSDFIYDIYRGKDMLCEYYQINGEFPSKDNNGEELIKMKIPRTNKPLFVAIIWALLLLPPVIKYVLYLITGGTMLQTIFTSFILILILFLSRIMLDSGKPQSSYGNKSSTSTSS